MKSWRILLILSLLLGESWGKDLPKSFSEGYLGEKNLNPYSGPWHPVFHHEPYFGTMSWDDDNFYNQLMYNSIWGEAPGWSKYFSQEIIGASTCPHDVLSKNFDEIRYGYRLVAMSYLLESLDAARNEMQLLRQHKKCQFELPELLAQCLPRSEDMRNFIGNLKSQAPYSKPTIGKSHNFNQYSQEWTASIGSKNQSLSASRVAIQAQVQASSPIGITAENALKYLEQSCHEDRAQFISLCSESDQIYGISHSPLATYLLATSNLVTLLNQEGMAQGCLRRFGQLMANKERHYPSMTKMHPLILSHLKKQFGNRFPQGRAFVYGALKEFRQKGLTKVFEDKVLQVTKKPIDTVVVAKNEPEEVKMVEAIPDQKVEEEKPSFIKQPSELELDNKTAFFQAGEVRQVQDLERADVDMLKFKYDHVFSSAELQLLETTLKEYTTRSALEEMHSWDKLGTKDAPLPLTFLKFLIDSQNHQGLHNVIGVLGDQFWVTNDIDKKAPIEFVELKSDSSTNYAWNLAILRNP